MSADNSCSRRFIKKLLSTRNVVGSFQHFKTALILNKIGPYAYLNQAFKIILFIYIAKTNEQLFKIWVKMFICTGVFFIFIAPFVPVYLDIRSGLFLRLQQSLPPTFLLLLNRTNYVSQANVCFAPLRAESNRVLFIILRIYSPKKLDEKYALKIGNFPILWTLFLLNISWIEPYNFFLALRKKIEHDCKEKCSI